MFKLECFRFGVPVSHRHESLEEAVRSAVGCVDSNEAAPHAITSQGGLVVWSRGQESIRDFAKRHGWTFD